MSKKYTRIVSALAVTALISLSCSRIDDRVEEGTSASEVIRYDVASSAVEGVKSSIDVSRSLGNVVLTSADGSYSLTLTGSAAPTSDVLEQAVEEVTKAAPVTGDNI